MAIVDTLPPSTTSTSIPDTTTTAAAASEREREAILAKKAKNQRKKVWYTYHSLPLYYSYSQVIYTLIVYVYAYICI